MTEGSSRTPWRNGFWSNKKMPAMIQVVDGSKMEAKNLIGLDYPDLGGSFPGTISHGDFGPAREEVARATGAERNNFELRFSEFVRLHGVVNEGGTEITLWGISNSLETMRWLSPEEVEQMKESRDDFKAPR